MSIVVQKYGGSSLSDAEAIKRVARRIVETQRQGHITQMRQIATKATELILQDAKHDSAEV